jgi:hypothetical protein
MLRVGQSGDRMPVGARSSAPVQTDPGAHPDSCKMDTGSFSGIKYGRGVLLTTHPLLVPWSRKSRAIPLSPTGPVTGLLYLYLYLCSKHIHYLISYSFFRKILFPTFSKDVCIILILRILKLLFEQGTCLQYCDRRHVGV